MSKAEDRYLEHFQDGRLRNCSSKEAFLLGYHQAKKDLIEKGIEFLKDHLEGYDIFGSDIERSVESFKLAMKDE